MPKRMKTSGFREFEKALGEVTKATQRRALGRRALKKTAEPITQRMAELAPDDPATGAPLDLTSSVSQSPRQKSGRATKFRKQSKTEQVIHIGPTKDGYPQAIMQEFGTVHHRAVGHMRRAWDAFGGLKALDRLGRHLWADLEKTLKRQERRLAKKRKG